MSNNPRSLEQFRSFWSNRANYGNITFNPDLLCNGNPIPVRDVDDAATTGSNSWRWLLGIDPAYIVENSKRLEEIWNNANTESPIITLTEINKQISAARLTQCVNLMSSVTTCAWETHPWFVDSHLYDQFDEGVPIPQFSRETSWGVWVDEEIMEFVKSNRLSSVSSGPTGKVLLADDIRRLCYDLSKLKCARLGFVYPTFYNIPGVDILTVGPATANATIYNVTSGTTSSYSFSVDHPNLQYNSMKGSLKWHTDGRPWWQVGDNIIRFVIPGLSCSVPSAFVGKVSSIEALVVIGIRYVGNSSGDTKYSNITFKVSMSPSSTPGSFSLPSWFCDTDELRARYYDYAMNLLGLTYANELWIEGIIMFQPLFHFDLDCDLDGIGWSYTPG